MKQRISRAWKLTPWLLRPRDTFSVTFCSGGRSVQATRTRASRAADGTMCQRLNPPPGRRLPVWQPVAVMAKRQQGLLNRRTLR